MFVKTLRIQAVLSPLTLLRGLTMEIIETVSPEPERPTQSGDLISARTDIKQVCFSERDPPDCRSGSPSLGRSLNPSLSAAAAAIKNMSKEKTGMSQDCGAPVQSLGQDA
ncbi:hypothetical protein D9C73_000354 [Collichthys lucidus]|uniref:Uncharacterized protein n=1 Tax=Collichthys lucidus TaxID=240159 RepID=A0A4U5TYB0_COLLU|nr:hypothetical protein D9C73_000354 [Collichthys lucidus]